MKLVFDMEIWLNLFFKEIIEIIKLIIFFISFWLFDIFSIFKRIQVQI